MKPLHVFTYFSIVLIFISLKVHANPNPLKPGKYIGLNVATEAFGEIVFDVKADGDTTVSGADGKGIMHANFNFSELAEDGPLILPDPAKQAQVNAVYSIFRRRNAHKPLVLIKSYLFIGSSFENSRVSLQYNDLPAILIFPGGVYDESAEFAALFTPQQAANGLVEKAVAKIEEKSGGLGSMPRLKTGGKNFRTCLDELRIERPN